VFVDRAKAPRFRHQPDYTGAGGPPTPGLQLAANVAR
jgi:hypothetical protein